MSVLFQQIQHIVCHFPVVGYFGPAIVVEFLSKLNTHISVKASVTIKQKEEKGNRDKTEVLICLCYLECK